MSDDNAGSLTENLIDLIESFGGPRPASKSLSELYQALATAIENFAPGSGAVATVVNNDGTLIISPTTGNVIASLNPSLLTIINTRAPYNSPALTGTPTAPTQTALSNNFTLATTAYTDSAVAAGTVNLAPKASPALTGTPTAPTASPGTNTTQLATTAFVEAAVTGGSGQILRNVQTASYIPIASDNLKCIEMNSVSATTVTFDTAVFADGNSLEICGINLGQVAILPGSGFTLDTADGANVLRTRYSTCSARFRSATECVLSGDLINLIGLNQQAPVAFNAASTTVTATFENPCSATTGTSLLAQVEIFTPTNNTNGAITDTEGGTWTALVSPSSDTLSTQHQYFICNNPAAGVTHAVTFTGASGIGCQLVVTEWSGGPFTYDVASTAAYTSATLAGTPAITPANFNELIIAQASADGTSSTMLSPTNGFTALATETTHSNNPAAYLLGQNIVSTQCQWTVSPADTGTGSIIALIGTL